MVLADVLFPDTIGGAGKVAHYLSHKLAQRKHEVHVLTRNLDGTLRPFQAMDLNLFVHRFSSAQRWGFGILFREIRNTRKSIQAIGQKEPFDLVCAHQSLVATGPLLSKHLRKIPFVYCFHSSWHEEYLIKKRGIKGKTPWSAKAIAFFMKQMEKRVLSKAMKIFVLSRYSGEQISAIHQVPPERVVIIPGGIDLNCFLLPEVGKDTVKKNLDIPLGKMVFLTVRNLVPRMGIENLLEAFKRSGVLREQGLLLIGGEGLLKESLGAMVREYGLEASVKFLGRISEDDLPRYYQAADFFVLPTRELEGFGLVILEAMACGTPVLGTPVGAIPETLGLFDRKLLFEGIQPEDMRRKLEDVINHPEHYRFDPGVCRKFVEERYSWEKMADAFENEVLRLINRAI